MSNPLYHVTLRPQALFQKEDLSRTAGYRSASVRSACLIHESDLSMGLANKIAYKFATKMYSTFEQPVSLCKGWAWEQTKVTGQEAPEPDELVNIQTHFNPKLPTVLFVGGSAGARVFNQLVTDHKQELTDATILSISLEILASMSWVKISFVLIMWRISINPWWNGDIVVTRGGANTIFELLAMAKLHLIVILGREASRGDQIENAAYFC